MRLLDRITDHRVIPSGCVSIVDGRHEVWITSVAAVAHADVWRVWVRKDGATRTPRTWSVPGAGANDVPWEGRDRTDLAGAPDVSVEVDGSEIVLTRERSRIRVASDPLRLTYERRLDDAWVEVLADRPTGAYQVGSDAVARDGFVAPEGTDVAHAILRREGERVVGLGEKSGALDRAGRRFEMRCLDAMGYDATRTEPLYKHWPFAIRSVPGLPGAAGVFYDNLSRCDWDLGRAKDNYHAPFWQWHADSGDVDLYVLLADSVLDTTRAFVALTGGTALPPRWSLGYGGSTMAYTDAPDAADRLLRFVAQTGEHRIPCDVFHLSSGYSSIGDKRYVFTWNRDKFPSPEATLGTFAAAGVHVAANIKPCLLRDHPLYEQLAAAGLFVVDAATGKPQLAPFWGDRGSHLDFTNPETVAWWREQVRTELLDRGIAATWNDNNEYEIWDENALCHGFGTPIRIGDVRPVQTLLMARASHAEQTAHAPEQRPYVVTRSGMPGIQRYAQTWSGDNDCSWETLRANTVMGLGMSLSGMYDIGHDVGGFTGERPSPELFLRWAQNGIVHPRFTIHSWHEDGSVNEPWMHPEVTDAVREAIAFRYRLMPYLMSLRIAASLDHEPILRPTFTLDEADPRLWHENADLLLGSDLLVASVVTERERHRTVALPSVPGGWWDWHSGAHHAGGDVILDAPLERLPILARAGSVIPLGPAVQRLDPALDTHRELRIFPPAPGVTAHGSWYEDHGGWTAPTRITWSIHSAASTVALHLRSDGPVAWSLSAATLPEGDPRTLTLEWTF